MVRAPGAWTMGRFRMRARSPGPGCPVRGLTGRGSGRELDGVLALDRPPDQATGPLGEGHLVRQAALQQDADPEVTAHIGHGDEGDILGDAQMHQVIGLDQDEQGLGGRGLDLGQLAPEVFEEDFLKPTVGGNRFLADQLKAAIERLDRLLLDEGA